jgi:hypothetical protein
MRTDRRPPNIRSKCGCRRWLAPVGVRVGSSSKGTAPSGGTRRAGSSSSFGDRDKPTFRPMAVGLDTAARIRPIAGRCGEGDNCTRPPHSPPQAAMARGARFVIRQATGRWAPSHSDRAGTLGLRWPRMLPMTLQATARSPRRSSAMTESTRGLWPRWRQRSLHGGMPRCR